MTFEDILYEVRNGVAWITINRPDKMNAFRGTTCDELIKALYRAGYDKSVGAIVLVVVSLLTPRPRTESRAFTCSLRFPAAD